jgi:hypothetical protein
VHHHRIFATFVAILGAVAIAACGSTSTTTKTKTVAAAPLSSSTSISSTSRGVSKAQAAKAYLADVAPANSAGDAFKKSINNNSTGPQIAQAARPLISAYNAANNKLDQLAQLYPPAGTDLKALVNSDSHVVADLSDASTVTSTNSGSWIQQLTTDLTSTKSDANIVRSDLGLPPGKS